MKLRHLIRVMLVVLGVLFVSTGTADAASQPGKPQLKPALSPARALGGEAFDCGTYKGNEKESPFFYHLYQSQRQKLEAAGPQTAAADFVFDDVVVIEDDGTVLFSGLNVFDTDFQTFRCTPNGVGGYDVAAIGLTFDAVLGANLGLGDDTNLTQALAFSFPYFGTPWTDVHVNSNGLVAFGADANPSGFFDSNDFFSEIPKIAVYFMDLNPAAGGGVFHKSEATKSTFTWNAIPEFGTANLNTIQLVLRDDGSFDITCNGITSTLSANGSPITLGLHPGGNPSLAIISFSDDLPFSGATQTGIYENYLNITNPLVNEVAMMQRFYQTFPDEFFQIIFFTNFTQTMGGFANERNISNAISGIGLGIFDSSGLYGSAGVLESRCNMNQLSVWPLDPTNRFFGSGNNFLTIMGQEAGHRWGAFMNFVDALGNVSNLILGRADAHWSYYVDVDNSSLEGGNWVIQSPGFYLNPTQIDFFGDVDEYSFGTRTPEEVSEFFYVGSPTNDLLQNRDNGTPPQGSAAFGTEVTVTIDDVIAAEGPRIPAERANKDLRQAFILIVQQGNIPTQAELDKIVAFRKAWEDYFEVSVDGRFAVNTSVTQTFLVARIKGIVRDATTTLPVPNFNAQSVQRGFNQFVPGGGRYAFRYMANALSGTAEAVQIIFTAVGYEPETLTTSIDYGTEECTVVKMQPILTGIGEDGRLPGVPALVGNYPNPFNPQTTLKYTVPSAARVRLAIYDVQGRLVRHLVNRSVAAGEHASVWDGRDGAGTAAGSGVYFVRFESMGRVTTQKIVLLK